MNRRVAACITTLVRIAAWAGICATAGVYSSSAASADVMRRIGYITFDAPAVHGPYVDAFREGLRRNGLIEGKNISVEWRYAEYKPAALSRLVSELIVKKVEIIVADGTQAVLAAKTVTSTVPIVAATSVDLVGVGAVTSLAKPGGNITGLTFIADALAGKRLALLKEVAPRIQRVGVLVNPGNPGTLLQLKEAQAAALGLAIDVYSASIRGADDVDHAILSIVGRVDGILVTDDLLLDHHRARIGSLALRNRLPSVCGYRVPDDKLCLLWYGPDIMELFRRAPTYVARILGGASPADIPVEQPTKFTLTINARTARILGIVVPQSLLTTADEIVP